MMDSRSVRNMYSTLSNKSEKLCISLAFIIRTHHDARSSESQNLMTTFYLQKVQIYRKT